MLLNFATLASSTSGVLSIEARIFFISWARSESFTLAELSSPATDVFVEAPDSPMLPETLDLFEKKNQLTIPMSSLIRSFNIANSVAFVVGEAKRQIGVLAKKG